MEEFFDKLSPGEARAFLRRFLEIESSRIKETVKRCAAEHIKMDYSMKSIPPFLRWVLAKLKRIQKEPDPAAPKWLRDNESYTMNLFDLDEASGILAMRAGYYLGESFVRSHSSLCWSTGDIKVLHANMPVVAGFGKKMEMAPIVVADNLLATSSSGPEWTREIKECLEYWNSLVPKS